MKVRRKEKTSETQRSEETESVSGKKTKLADHKMDHLREELSSLPLGELLSLKDHMPAKLYKKAIFSKLNTDDNDGVSAPGDAPAEDPDNGEPETTARRESDSEDGPEERKQKTFKRDNRKRPREMSAKKPVSVIREVFATKKRRVTRDPRFDNATGDFNSHVFGREYSFLKDMRHDEYQVLKKEIKEETDPKRREKLRLLKQRMENQRRADEEEERKKRLKHEVRAVNMERMKKGKDPFYVKKSEFKRRLMDDRFERLEKQGKLKKYQERREKKLSKKDRHPVP